MAGKIKCALCDRPAAPNSILCKEHHKAAQELTEALEQEQEEARRERLAEDLLRGHYA